MYRILIVEDDAGIAKAIKEQAQMWGLQAEYVEDFRDVMAAFAGFSPLSTPSSGSVREVQ